MTTPTRVLGRLGRLTSNNPTLAQAGELRSARVESLRALAALAVLEGHVFGLTSGFGAAPRLGYLHRVLLGGGYGVCLFFALSGFLLYRGFARQAFAHAGVIDIRRYFVNRALRILPLYYSVVVVMMLVSGHAGSPVLWLRFIFFGQSYFPDSLYIVDGVAWSLAVELHFYLLLPLAAWLLTRASGGRLGLAATWLTLAGAVLFAIRFLALSEHLAPSIWQYNTLTNLVFFVPGMLLALVAIRVERQRPRWLRGPLESSAAWLVAAASLWLLVWYDYAFEPTILAAAFVTVAAAVLPLRPSVGTRVLEWRALSLVGVASYSLYLWHWPIVQALVLVSWLPHSYLPQLAVALPLCVGVAAVSYALVEAPFLRLRRRWSDVSPAPPGRRAVPTATPAAAR